MKFTMKKTFLFTALATLAVSLLNVAHAQETLTQATVLAVKGSAQVRLSGGLTVPATVGLKLSQGAAITTGNDAQVSIQAHDGIVAVLAGTSQVEIEKLSVSPNGTRNTMMNLRSGNLATSLDPSRKSINNYGVRTAKGVAMAHGTTMTVSVIVSVNGNYYTVSVLAGNVTVNWEGGLAVSIVGNTPSDVTSNGQQAMSLHDALATGSIPGITDALTAAAAAVATVATSTGQITAVIDAIAHAAGTSSTASTLVAGATAAAVGAAVVNSNLVQGTTTTAVASAISTAAVTSATDANNPSAAALIVSSAVNAVAKTISGTQENAVAKTLVDAANAVTGVTTIQPGQVTGGVHASQNEKGTPITPIDPNLIVNVSPSGG